jgi:mono/diheme cytochrome c family protein
MLALGLAASCSEPDDTLEAARAQSSAGQVIYRASCGSCHRLGEFDSQGIAPDLASHQAEITSSHLRDHHEISLDTAAIADLRAFVATR